MCSLATQKPRFNHNRFFLTRVMLKTLYIQWESPVQILDRFSQKTAADVSYYILQRTWDEVDCLMWAGLPKVHILKHTKIQKIYLSFYIKLNQHFVFISSSYSIMNCFKRMQPFLDDPVQPKWPGLFLELIRDHSNTTRSS